jgi:hypothetical protein
MRGNAWDKSSGYVGRPVGWMGAGKIPVSSPSSVIVRNSSSTRRSRANSGTTTRPADAEINGVEGSRLLFHRPKYSIFPSVVF